MSVETRHLYWRASQVRPLTGSDMVPDLKRIGRKAKELEPLNLRRLRKKRSNSILRKKFGLRKRLKREDLERNTEKEEKDRLRNFLRESVETATV